MTKTSNTTKATCPLCGMDITDFAIHFITSTICDFDEAQCPMCHGEIIVRTSLVVTINQCDHIGGFWRCEREKGHRGPHYFEGMPML